MVLAKWKLILSVLSVLVLSTTVFAAAPHIIIYHGTKLEKPIVVNDWEQNHRLMASLSDEGLVKPDELSSREYIELSLFWGPQWLHYKLDGGSTAVLRPDQGNQNAWLYLGKDNSPPILVLEERLPRYVGADGVLMLTEHGVPTKTNSVHTVFQHKREWIIALAITGLITAGVAVLIRRQRRNSSATVGSMVKEDFGSNVLEREG